jgi:hypothetical protein
MKDVKEFAADLERVLSWKDGQELTPDLIIAEKNVTAFLEALDKRLRPLRNTIHRHLFPDKYK